LKHREAHKICGGLVEANKERERERERERENRVETFTLWVLFY
jgi:hypothetical protein